MKLRKLLKKVIDTPLPILLVKIKRRIKKCFYFKTQKFHDLLCDTRKGGPHLGLHFLPIGLKDLSFTEISNKRALQFWEKYKMHQFDLLGSGWIDCGYLDNALGFEDIRYSSTVLKPDREGLFLEKNMPIFCQKKSKQYWKMIEPPYQGINWQRDFKSGYEWSLTDWFYPLKLADKLGGDIKVPWELGRLQHLPRLAICYSLLEESRFDIKSEYQNQLLDFFSQNPIRWGVQSMCCMDMGIRIANIALAHTLFAIQGAEFDENFQQWLAEQIYDSCNHLFCNLEWSDEFTNNHYLANLAGLLFGSAFLNQSKLTTKWMKFAGEELKKEFEKQFYEEGTNKEGSTAYHRLSSEIIAYSFALMKRYGMVKNLDYERLEGSLRFLQALTRPDGLITSIGDNDSGLFFRLSFTGSGVDEELNDARPTISALLAYFNSENGKYLLENSLIGSMLGAYKKPVLKEVKALFLCEKTTHQKLKYFHQNSIDLYTTNLKENITLFAFPKFGLYIWKSPILYLCVCLADNGQNGNGGHAHNDKLSFELFVNEKSIFEDPGTYVYTASEELRNRYRSTLAHNTIWTGREQNDFINMFSMENSTECQVITLTKTKFIGEVRYKDVIQVREITINETGICIKDFCNCKFTYGKEVGKCSGYGKIRSVSI